MDQPESSTKKRGVRGSTTCSKVLKLQNGAKLKVLCEKGQPMGTNGSHLSSWLGILSRDGQRFSLDRLDWHHIDDGSKDHAWRMILEKFELEEELKHWIYQSLGKHWRDYKCKLKKKFYDNCTTDEERYKNCPKTVVPGQWHALVHFWNSDVGKKRSEINKINRSY